MWLYLLIVALVVIAIAGGVLLGGVFTIILIPLAVIALVSALAYALAAGAARQQANAEGASGSGQPVTGRRQTQAPTAPSSPESLADARRSQQ